MNRVYKWTIGKIKSEYRSMTEAMCTGEREFSKWLDGLLIAEGETLPGHEKHVALVRRHAERYSVMELSAVYGFMCGKIGAERTKAYDGLTIEQADRKKAAREKGVSLRHSIIGEIKALLKPSKADNRYNPSVEEFTKELPEGLNPERSMTEAIAFCARLVCYVWNKGEHGGKRRSADYVFIKAQKGDSLFGECKRARELLKRWTISPGTVQTEAARLHAAQSGTKHKKRDGMERPETMHEAEKKSREKEQAEIRAEERAQGKRKAKQGTRQSGKKR